MKFWCAIFKHERSKYVLGCFSFLCYNRSQQTNIVYRKKPVPNIYEGEGY